MAARMLWIGGGAQGEERIARQGPGAVAGRPGRPHCAGSEGSPSCWKRKTPAKKGSGRGKFCGLVRESVIHETLARTFQANVLRERMRQCSYHLIAYRRHKRHHEPECCQADRRKSQLLRILAK
jgi:hypothetical protein